MNRSIQTTLTVICGVSLFIGIVSRMVVFEAIAVIAGCPFALKSGWEALKERRLDVNILMILAGAGAIALGHLMEAAVLLFLFSLSSTLEEFALSRTKSAIEGLIKLRPDVAFLVKESGDEKVAVTSLQPGDLVRVLAYEQIPLDGKVVQGSSHLNQAAMTGESVPVTKEVGDKVLSGTQNLEGMLVIEVTEAAGDTTLEKIVGLVRDAQENKASGERVSQWFGQTYTIFVIVATVISILVRFGITQDIQRSLYASLTLLVALSPCALVISTPAATLSALAWAAKNGMLIRGGEFIELAGMADAVAMDKTGTLTNGKPVLDEICVCGNELVAAGAPGLKKEEHACWSGGMDMSQASKAVLRAAAAAEQYSTHPIAEAIVSAAVKHGIEVPVASEQQAVPGLGVTAIVDGKMVKIGQRRFFDNLSEDFLIHAREQQAEGMTVAVLEYDGQTAALGMRDAPRPEAMSVLDELKKLGIAEITMLTGDNSETASAVAKELGIAKHFSGLMPDEKEAEVSRLSDSHKSLIFVGDGVNDAPSLARASVGVAMGGLGSDIALNAADVVFMQDNLTRLPELIKLGRKTNKIIRGNLIFAAGVIAVLTIGSVVLDITMPGQRNLILPFAVVGHEGSTVLVILNGLRLLRGFN